MMKTIDSYLLSGKNLPSFIATMILVLRRYRHVTLSIVFFAFIMIGCTVSDEEDNSPQIRIISLAPHITEIIYALGAQDQLVAVTDFCRYPKEAASRDKIGGLLNPDIEKIVLLKPTHLFGLPSHEKLAGELSKFGLTVTMLPNETVHDVVVTIGEIGDMVNRKEQAARLINSMQMTLDSLGQKKINRTIPAVLIIGREDKTLNNISVAGKNTYLAELWNIVGGENSYKDLTTPYGTINLESLLLRDPEVIIEFDMNKQRGVYRSGWTSEWDFLKNLQAVQKGNLFVIGGNHTLIPGPRLVLLVEDFAKIIEVINTNP